MLRSNCVLILHRHIAQYHNHASRWFSATATPITSTVKPKVIILAGPTGIGKTNLSLQLARHLNGSILSIDSVQQYRGLDIGSAKVSKDVRAEIKHYGIDIASIGQQINVADYSTHAHAALNEILSEGKLPIIVGGSGFYLRWLLHPPRAPPVTPEIRARATAMIADPTPWPEKLSRASAGIQLDGKVFLLRQLQGTKARADPQTMQYALELVFAAGGAKPKTYVPPTIEDIRALHYDYRCFYLTCSREWLNRWTDFRCEQMIREGLLKEVKGLEAREKLSQQTTLASAIGYRQSLDFLSRLPAFPDPTTPASTYSASFLRFLSEFQSASRGYIRRQDIWFRKEPFYQFLRLHTPDLPKFPGATLADLKRTAIPGATWFEVRSLVEQQLALTEEEYWSSQQWSVRPSTAVSDGDDDPSDGASYDDLSSLSPPSPSSISPSTLDPATATTTTHPALQQLPFTPSPKLAQSIQAALRAQTHCGSKQAQRQRKHYTTQLFHFGEKQHVEEAIQQAIEYDPNQRF